MITSPKLKSHEGFSSFRGCIFSQPLLSPGWIRPGRTSADVLLLSRQNSPTREKRWVIWRAVFNVSTTIIDAGIMSILATLKVLGVIPAFLLIVLLALLVNITVNFMLRATYAGQSTTYTGLIKRELWKDWFFGSTNLSNDHRSWLLDHVPLYYWRCLFWKRRTPWCSSRMAWDSLVEFSLSIDPSHCLVCCASSCRIPACRCNCSKRCPWFIFKKDKIIAVVMIVLAVVTSVTTIAANIYNMIGSSS